MIFDVCKYAALATYVHIYETDLYLRTYTLACNRMSYCRLVFFHVTNFHIINFQVKIF